MPRRDASVLPLAALPPFLSGSRGGQIKLRLSDACLTRLKNVTKLVNQMDLAIVNEIHFVNQVEASRARKLLAPEQMQQLERFSQNVTNRESVVAVIQTEEAIKTYLCDTECSSATELVNIAICRIQIRNNYVWKECRNRAEIFLDLGVSIIRYLEPIKVELQEDAEDILLAMRMKLSAIKAFYPVYLFQSKFERENHDPISSHLFATLLEHFIEDDPLPTKVAYAYAESDSSRRAILSATTILVVFISIVPIVFAWQRSATEVGSRDDADFYGALQTMLMQLLNLFTMMLPVSRFTPAVAWRLAWAFAALAGICAVGTPVLYVMLPVGWSLVISYIASAAEAAVVLQIMLNSSFFRGNTA